VTYVHLIVQTLILFYFKSSIYYTGLDGRLWHPLTTTISPLEAVMALGGLIFYLTSLSMVIATCVWPLELGQGLLYHRPLVGRIDAVNRWTGVLSSSDGL